ncbi:Heavy metal translocating P-type ATPase OS=Tsukamurella paurometabola (strain ATCC 8368 / DSM/ CCUG 35730 / CIP 100753 / JCM 10117 / KCTC 9821 / NBRC 16120/ NCIMB 702349 / NCTC 13040) OX=521096 GN=Tpau_0081 PE=3 SV=1 [Tsukamurella paurometabola]|uniref:Cation-transporting P-type ATPase B n=1 Tax=Tsukamurella paurometabola (strain ATCC 8368 / DSM 20162 / CCUG 35730 / CIP 100753 / JCM 10117 / KCTC 9821 / NBRC 16120 / NCIMB 702349 / NCTC 13040) TaxID=521096 RepID=D5UPW7_TSUPD|nr:cation-translocating P-type ATPase [Tsukamurella paurometabola]ADG76735.1 heavy metal translocating P-type ATPase [Tsukamurella paurometabola DSM 20162]SUP41408.1 Copper-exporting P-type ATPase A [Tsukamurella paurometabola]
MTDLQSAAPPASADESADATAEAQRTFLDVGGMTCAACVGRVERKLNKLDGVRAVVNLATRTATVEHAPTVTVEQLTGTVEAAGYTAAPKSPNPRRAMLAEERERRDVLRRLVVSLVLFVPAADLSIVLAIIPSTRFPGWQWVLLALSLPVVTWGAWPLHKKAWQGARHGAATMDTLVSVGIISATAWSVVTVLTPGRQRPDPHGLWNAIVQSDPIYLEVAMGVTVFVLAGRYFEASARAKAASALRDLSTRGARDVSVLVRDGSELRIPIGELREDQVFVVRPGETIATDGVVESGSAFVDNSAMTGESRPVPAGPGDRVVGGTVCQDGRLTVRAIAVGEDTTFAAMLRLVEDAQATKARMQRLADRVSAVFVPCVFAIAALTFAGWMLFGGSIDDAVKAAIAVLVIACPCALGLATPVAFMVASGRGAQLGVYVRGHQALEATESIDTVVFDKTGTVTTGLLEVAAIAVADGFTEAQVLRLAGAVETASEHAVARAVVARAGADLPAVEDFRAVPGLGATGTVDGRTVRVGNPRFVSPGVLAPAVDAAAEAGRTVAVVEVDGAVAAVMEIADTIKPDARAAITRLHEAGITTVLLTGDNAAAAAKVAAAVGIDDIRSDVLPEGKVAEIRALQAEGRRVAMVGDGVNDGPALAAADLGLAMGTGTDVAQGAADVVLMREELSAVPDALGLARATLKTIKTNLVWAFGYNVAAIPIAAAGLLNPLISAAAMSFSSFFVVWNSLRLRRFGSR